MDAIYLSFEKSIMRPLSNFNFELLDTYPKSLKAIEEQIRELIIILQETEYPFCEEDKKQLMNNIQWLKRFYESAERNLLNG